MFMNEFLVICTNWKHKNWKLKNWTKLKTGNVICMKINSWMENRYMHNISIGLKGRFFLVSEKTFIYSKPPTGARNGAVNPWLIKQIKKKSKLRSQIWVFFRPPGDTWISLSEAKNSSSELTMDEISLNWSQMRHKKTKIKHG